MPVVVAPTCFLAPVHPGPTWTEVRIESRVVEELVVELFRCYPALGTRFTTSDGRPSLDWFGLYRDQDEDDLRRTPEVVIGADDRVHLVNFIGC